METLQIVRRIYEQYSGTGWHMVLFWFCLFLLAIVAVKWKNKKSRMLVFISLGVMAIFACPLTAHIIILYCIEEETYWRMLWLLPVPLVIAYTATEGVWNWNIKKTWLRGILAFVFAAAIVFAGTFVLSREQFSWATGLEKLPEPVIEVCQVIEEAALQNQDQEKCVLAEDTLVSYLRQYDGSIKMPYGRIVMRGLKKKKLHEVLNDPECDYHLLTRLARKNGCNYLVFYTGRDYDKQVPEGTCLFVAQVGDYTIYRLL